jgi:hypothetical protein
MKNLDRTQVKWRFRTDVVKYLQTAAKNSGVEGCTANQIAEQILVERTMRWNKKIGTPANLGSAPEANR